MVEKGQKGEEHPSVTVFREYLRIKTVQPNPDYESAVTFLQRIAGELDLQFQCVRKENGEVTVVILSWEGSDPSLPSIMLNSHMDVVPVFPEHWTYEPFSAHKTENGNIYARGSQDMKCVGIQYIEAIRKLKIQGVTLARTLHVTFVPDEEIGGAKGMREFVKLDEFKTMNVGFALDEGLANPTDAFKIYYGERVTWWVKITCRGPPGHASRFIEGSAAEKMCKVVQSIHTFREEQKKRLDSNPELRLGDVTTVNWTVSEGGVQPNVVPSDMSSGYIFLLSQAHLVKRAPQHRLLALSNVNIHINAYYYISQLVSQYVADKTKPWYSPSIPGFSFICNAGYQLVCTL
ncbi:aminoacylase-1-like isoform X4 [Acropora millepora]|uniref:aminoacylase-1-like isoform X4 n=1 Tax=Acropora millepora TaxID=45264 RepID=UPI001CF5EEDE|nr:aminoacylase-1-like isoform X4 [Acropora millepora]